MRALTRILIATIRFVLLSIVVTAISFGVVMRSASLHGMVRPLFALGIIASALYAVGYLVAPLFRRGGPSQSSGQAWCATGALFGAVLILYIATMLMLLIDTMVLEPDIFAAAQGRAGGGLSNLQIDVFNIVWMSVFAAVALFYLRYPSPRLLRRRD
jgi:hypothetical protein